MFSKKATKIEKIFTVDTYLVNVKSMVKIWSIFVAFLENMNFKKKGAKLSSVGFTNGGQFSSDICCYAIASVFWLNIKFSGQ